MNAHADDVMAFPVGSDSDRDEMLVGHHPFMEELTAHLTAGDPDRVPAFKFQNGAIVCRKRGDEKNWYIARALVPHIP